MILFLIKSTVCTGILLAAYHLMLEGEKMHTFNRLYLLFSLCFAVVIPFIHLETTPESVSFAEIITLQELVAPPHIANLHESPPATTNRPFPFLINCIYGTIALIFLCRFIKNLSGLSAKIVDHPTVNYRNAKLVLLNEKVLPHTFLHYIFLNKKDYDHQCIEQELLTHELAHVYQRHSFDILFVELFKVIFWFNPFVYLFEKAIKLNHEFLADAAVIKSYQDISAYQHLLLSKTSQPATPYLISSLNFSITKKRFMMMTKEISPVQVMLKKAALLPLFLALVVTFTTKITAQEIKQDQKPANKETTNVQSKSTDLKTKKVLTREDSLKISDSYHKNSTIWSTSKNADGSTTKITYDEFSDEHKLALFPRIPVKNPPTQEQLNVWTDPNIYGVWLDGKRIDNTLLNNYKPSDFGIHYISQLAKNAKNYGKHEFQVNVETLSHFEEWQEKRRKFIEEVLATEK